MKGPKENSQFFKTNSNKMLNVSSSNITFTQSETIKSLTLENLYPQNIIFKIKVNLVGFLNIQPSKGFIRANSTVPFIIKSLSKENFEVKVLFSYGLISEKNNDFNDEWEKIKESGKFEHSIIMVKRIQKYRSNERMNNFQQKIKQVGEISDIKSIKETQKLARKTSLQKQRRREASRSPQKKIGQGSSKSFGEKVKWKQSQKFEQYSSQIFMQEQRNEDSPFYSAEQMQELIEQLHNSEKMLGNEKIKNIKLVQQLSISEGKLKQITQDKMHIEIHKSIGIVCEDYHTTFTKLVILGLACFVFGFFLGNIEASLM